MKNPENTPRPLDLRFNQAVKALQLTEPFTAKPITAQELIDVLKEDVILAVERPGSWEGANMLTVLESHGFLLD